MTEFPTCPYCKVVSYKKVYSYDDDYEETCVKCGEIFVVSAITDFICSKLRCGQKPIPIKHLLRKTHEVYMECVECGLFFNQEEMKTLDKGKYEVQ